VRRVVLLFGPVMFAVLLATAGCSGSSSSKTNPGSGPANTTVSPATTVTPATTVHPTAPPCTIPQNNGGDHDSDNNGGPSDGDGCNQ
jgi:hypothetical protein